MGKLGRRVCTESLSVEANPHPTDRQFDGVFPTSNQVSLHIQEKRSALPLPPFNEKGENCPPPPIIIFNENNLLLKNMLKYSPDLLLCILVWNTMKNWRLHDVQVTLGQLTQVTCVPVEGWGSAQNLLGLSYFEQVQ